MGCMSTMLRYTVFFFNLVFFITGGALIALGSYMHIHMQHYFDFLGDTGFVNSAIVFIVIGIAITLISFFGCCGACTKNACMMYTFGSFMAIIILVEIGGAVTVYFYKDQAEATIMTSMKKGLHNYQPDNIEFQGVTKTWDTLQQGYECCGIDSYMDWKNATEFSHGKDVPDSCCQTEHTDCGKGKLESRNEDDIYTTGCVTKFTTDLEDNAALAGGIGAALLAIQIITCIVAFVLGCKMQKSVEAGYI